MSCETLHFMLYRAAGSVQRDTRRLAGRTAQKRQRSNMRPVCAIAANLRHNSVDSPWTRNSRSINSKIIKNYYENRDAISLQRLSELVTELYLAEGQGPRAAVEVYRRSAGETRSAGRANRASAEKG